MTLAKAYAHIHSALTSPPSEDTAEAGSDHYGCLIDQLPDLLTVDRQQQIAATKRQAEYWFEKSSALKRPEKRVGERFAEWRRGDHPVFFYCAD